ncbi:MAG: peptidoglycan bridge formation glycyltransferase FemA/FemB family protein [Candidatus Sungbacteria bacterium]|nr:peptidoglycan bridge formation glycyltransferase FemA/FemB family protein [Candidatus Sungbacteria bacterium]
MYLISEVKSKELWDSFLAEAKPHTFLHSWNWGEFQRESEVNIWRFGVYNGNRLTALMLVLRIDARRGSFLFCPHGPIFLDQESGIRNQAVEFVFKALVVRLKELAKKENVGFIRISSLLSDSSYHRSLFYNLGFRRSPIHMHPERAWMLDLSRSEDELLKSMRKQTRHCIRNAAMAGVAVSQSTDSRDIGEFYKIYKATVARQDFVPFSREYLEKEFSLFAKDGQAAVFLGRYNGEVISGAIVIFANGSGFYHHGASNPQFAKVPAAHLLQWEIIREAKKRGFLWYNFWGVAPENAVRHPWAGLSLFKKGFGGSSEEYIPAQDLVLKPVYWITYCVERIRRWKRGL